MRELAHEVQAYTRLFMNELEKRLLIDLDNFRLRHRAYSGIALRPREQTQLAGVLAVAQCRNDFVSPLDHALGDLQASLHHKIHGVTEVALMTERHAGRHLPALVAVTGHPIDRRHLTSFPGTGGKCPYRLPYDRPPAASSACCGGARGWLDPWFACHHDVPSGSA